ncbi:cysteine desulfurase [Candidatus Woesearchaeota archaeon]|jgi:cysteine desulfurase/selenocysteine lyase|nr:cysteine desulfurase [Candidatus Woesearchaeota archaeon]|tara:strand:- start:743 stop:1957 length:1215 start_codon:yes stop_codon:yes gene_type:complete
MLKIEKIRKDFSILKRKVHGKPLVYLDNAATTQKPKVVIDAVKDYYENYNANIHRSIHVLGEEATAAYEEAHKKIADFINADFEEVIFTKSTTESLNLLAYSLTADLKPGDEIVISEMEHHSNFVPWQQLALKKKLKLKFIEINKGGTLNEESIKENITKKTKIVSVTHVSNVLGTVNDIKEIGKIAHENNALMIVDAAQSVPHMKIDVKDLDADFLAFSGHKMLGPTGIGVLYGKKELLEEMQPFLYGGEMIKEVTFENTKFNDLPWKFEAGTPNIAQGIGLGIAVDYLNKVGMENIENHEKELVKYAYEKLNKIKEVEIYGPSPEKRSGLIAFNVKNVHAHDTAQILDGEGIAIRAGHHCAMPLASKLGIVASARASFYVYNTKEEIDKLVEGIHKVIKVFK